MNALRSIELVPESPMARANRLMAEARVAAREQVQELERAIEAAATLSAEVAAGGDIYPAGVRELCRRLSAEAEAHSKTLGVLSTRLF